MSGIARVGQGRFIAIGRYRMRKGLCPDPKATGPLTDGPDWSYPDGTSGMMNKAQSQRYLRDQEFGRTMIKFNRQFKAIEEMRKANKQLPDKDTNQ